MVYEVNLRGVWWCTKHAAPYLRASRRGPAIVNASSSGGLTGAPQNDAYAVPKSGVIALTRTTAVDLAPTVRCNCSCAAAVDTPMLQNIYDAAEDREAIDRALLATHLIPRLGTPDEVAKLVCYLASDDAAWITGSAFVIDGGRMAWRGTRG
jgi:NAD(P)-dependent dehydrogenase (short-subunit alcohol dehydrogenase family)